MRVLLVDDEPAVRRLMAHSLREAGYSVLEAGTFAEAVGQPGPFDLLVLDPGLPDGNGREIGAHFPEARAFIVSGKPPADLEKPFSMNTLLRRLSLFLEGT